MILTVAIVFLAVTALLWFGRRFEDDFENGMTPYERFKMDQVEGEIERAKRSKRRARVERFHKRLLPDDPGLY